MEKFQQICYLNYVKKEISYYMYIKFSDTEIIGHVKCATMFIVVAGTSFDILCGLFVIY